MLHPPFARFAVILLLAGASAHAGPPKSLEALVGEAEQLLETEARAAYPNATVDAHMQALDPRLDLPPCAEAELTPRGQQRHGRVPVAVRCSGPQPWSIFLTGEVQVAVPVVVTTRPIRRGEVISAAMITTRTRDLSGLRSLFHTDAADVVGKEARRNLSEGSVVLASQLAEPVAVARGNKVQIVARHGTVEITSLGEALADGIVGEQVRVRNLESGRIVRGWVEAPGRIVTSPAGKGGR